MRKLTDVYIKVTKSNVEELRTIIQPNLDVDDIVAFNSDCLNSFFYGISIGNRKKVSLTELKRLIDTIPTREEIKRLKQQISGYKTNLSLTNERCKELQSDNESLVQKLKTTEERYLRLSDHFDVLQREFKVLLENLKCLNDVNAILEKENKQLKNRKWWKLIKF